MKPIILNDALRAEYAQLYASLVPAGERQLPIARTVATLIAPTNRARYEEVARVTGVPWFVVGGIHYREASSDFSCHLHNGDPLRARTVHVPVGRPSTGQPPFGWAESAIDAIQWDRLDQWRDWSVAGTLYAIERYNGLGYRQYHAETLSPYLWSFSNHYLRGKYAEDGKWNGQLRDAQCGVAVLFAALADAGVIAGWQR